MATATPPPTRRNPGGPDEPAGRSDRSPWNWLLLVPLIALVWPPLYNRVHPTLWNIPFFYWYQMVVIPVGVICTVAVYLATRPKDGR